MVVANTIVTLLLSALLCASAYRKLTHDPAILESLRRVHFRERNLPLLAGLLLAGAAGLLAGLLWPPIGVMAATGVLAYFVTTVAFHMRARDFAHLTAPLLFAALAAVALMLRLTTAG